MRARCPFYGFRWPDRKTQLVETGGNECGLDLDVNGACRMEESGRTVNFDFCEQAWRAEAVIAAASRLICFIPAGETRPIPFQEWRDEVMHPPARTRPRGA